METSDLEEYPLVFGLLATLADEGSSQVCTLVRQFLRDIPFQDEKGPILTKYELHRLKVESSVAASR